MKVLSQDAAQKTAERLHQMGWHIVLTAGCFDMLHPGHVRNLQWAARHGTCLFVGVNDDQSVARMKGCGRPMLSAAVRAEMVAALECVNHVVVFPDATPEDLVKRIRPHVYVKGQEYEGRPLPEVEGAPGHIDVLFAPQIPVFSTSDLLRYMDARFGGRVTDPWPLKETP